MVFLVIGILVFLGCMIGFGFCQTEGKVNKWGESTYDVKWKVNAKQLIALIGVVFILLGCFATVKTGHTGIVTTFGQVEDYTFEAGMHFKAPWVKIIQMDNRNQKGTQELSCFTSDIQEVTVIYTINYQINKQNAQTIYKTIGVNYYDTVIVPKIQNAVKTVTAQYTAENLVESRDELGVKIDEILTETLAEYNIELLSTSVENIDFTDAFTIAVEEKQVAVQKKLQAEADAQAKVIAAQGNADSNALLETSITDKILMQQLIEKWDGKYPTVMSGDANTMFDLSSVLATQ